MSRFGLPFADLIIYLVRQYLYRKNRKKRQQRTLKTKYPK